MCEGGRQAIAKEVIATVNEETEPRQGRGDSAPRLLLLPRTLYKQLLLRDHLPDNIFRLDDNCCCGVFTIGRLSRRRGLRGFGFHTCFTAPEIHMLNSCFLEADHVRAPC